MTEIGDFLKFFETTVSLSRAPVLRNYEGVSDNAEIQQIPVELHIADLVE